MAAAETYLLGTNSGKSITSFAKALIGDRNANSQHVFFARGVRC